MPHLPKVGKGQPSSVAPRIQLTDLMKLAGWQESDEASVGPLEEFLSNIGSGYVTLESNEAEGSTYVVVKK